MSIGKGTRATVNVAATAKDPSFACFGGSSSSRETVVVVKMVKVNSSVDE